MEELTGWAIDILYQVAVMKVRHDLGGLSGDGFDDRLHRTLGELGIEPGTFHHFVSNHHDDLVRVCREVGF